MLSPETKLQAINSFDKDFTKFNEELLRKLFYGLSLEIYFSTELEGEVHTCIQKIFNIFHLNK